MIKTRSSEGRNNQNKKPTVSHQREISDKIARELKVHPMLVRKIIALANYRIGQILTKEHKEVQLYGFGRFKYLPRYRKQQVFIETQNEKKTQ